MAKGITINEVESALWSKADQAMQAWAGHLDKVKAVNESVDDLTLATLALTLENTKGFVNEDTTSKDVKYVDYGFDLITAVLPNLISNEILSTQPLPQRHGQLFFMDFRYGTKKGQIKVGDIGLSSVFSGIPKTAFDYSMSGFQELPVAIGDGGTKAYHFTTGGTPPSLLNQLPIIGTSIVVEAGTVVGVGDVSGNITGAGVDTGSVINLTTGEITLNFVSNVALGTPIVVSCQIDTEANPDAIGAVDLQIRNLPVSAVDNKLRARFTLQGAYDLKSAFGKAADQELRAAMASEVRQEIDARNLHYVSKRAGNRGISWSATPPHAVAYVDHKLSFVDLFLVPMSQAIFYSTRRAEGNIVVAGKLGMRVIEQLPGFQRTGQFKPGPHFSGVLNNRWKVYNNPYFTDDEVVVAYKGDMFLEAGCVYSVYMPLIVTPTIMLDDQYGRFGLANAAATTMVNANFYAVGTVTA